MNVPEVMDAMLQENEEEYPGALVTGWVVVYEMIDPADGEKFLRLREAPNLTPWTRIGMLTTAIQGEWSSVGDEDGD